MIKKCVFTFLVVACMATIFYFSAKPASASTEMSDYVEFKIGEFFIPGFDSWSQEDKVDFAESIMLPVRKGAHALEYFILAFLLIGMLSSYSFSKNNYVILSFLFSVIYASSDEIHQAFVIGRSCQMTDVVIDSLGAMVACFIFC